MFNAGASTVVASTPAFIGRSRVIVASNWSTSPTGRAARPGTQPAPTQLFGSAPRPRAQARECSAPRIRPFTRWLSSSQPDGDERRAQKLHAQYYPLCKDLFIETNPVPVKAALAMMGLTQEEYRLPLVPMSGKNRETLKSTLRACGVLKK